MRLSAHRPRASIGVFSLLLLLFFCQSALAAGAAKNVIVLIADGTGAEQYTLARWFKGAPLAQDAILTGMVRTHISDSVVADSAPSGSAYATGTRTSDKFISVGPRAKVLSSEPSPPEELRYRPLATVLEGARVQGRSTGIVATAGVWHATPAAFYAHVPSRTLESTIMKQGVHQGIDVVLGGGRGYLTPKHAGGLREDGQDLAAVLRERGYELPTTAKELGAAKGPKIFGLFAGGHMAPDLDRAALAPQEPALAEMTAKAIAVLSKNPKGFFLMVEGSQVDWADHANDPAHLISDLLAFDRAVQTALDYAKKRKDTLVLVVSDHNTGGMSIGNMRTNKSYTQTSVEDLLEPLRKMRASAAALWARLGKDQTPERLQAVVREDWGLSITAEEAKLVLEAAAAYPEEPYYALGQILCPRYTVLGWTTHGHTGGDVPMFAYGPGGPKGLIAGFEFGQATAKALGIDLAALNRRLFVDAALAFPPGSVRLDETDKNAPVLRIEHQGRRAELPVNTNLLRMDGRELHLEGLVIHAPDTGRTYVPAQAVQRILGKRVP
ncbi:MAG: alkaline phosphatase [Humidesulfovibrio sp.]|uniref:alkaline phosphatase n=1 Tax=Humidesulfovibrio sp. TaxID=2910988 RepID=UPI002734F850|nr:alkaline phosphatase [Humidesulfovibrio sp.]MDP2847610.1 alkaline phosphatase [Humidesulfovibrio sp.]